MKDPNVTDPTTQAAKPDELKNEQATDQVAPGEAVGAENAEEGSTEG